MKAAIALLLAFGSVLTAYSQIAPTETNLRSAVAAGGTISFSSAGVIQVSSPMSVAMDTIIDGTTNPITLDGKGATNIFVVLPGVHLSFTNITFANGTAFAADAAAGTPAAQGGAIQNNGGIIVAVNCVFTNNAATVAGGTAFGGAIWQGSGAISIQGGSFISNRVVGGVTEGGAICADGGGVEIDGTMFQGNSTTPSLGNQPLGKSPATGGAIAFKSGTLQIANARFFGNKAAAANDAAVGGAVAILAGSATIGDSYFLQNQVYGGEAATAQGASFPGDGAAIFIGDAANVAISGSTFERGTSYATIHASPFGSQPGAARGGAISNRGTASVVNSTIFGNSAEIITWNQATTFGGGIYNEGTIGLTNVTIAGNISSQPILYSAAGTFVLKNCLLGSNTGITSTSITDAGNNLSATASPAFTQPSSKNNLDLRLGPLGDYGGNTPTIRVLAGSPAVDAADDSAAPPTDQRGRARPYGAHADVGAFESSAPFMIFGAVHGYLDPAASVNIGTASSGLDSSGRFVFTSPGGPITLTLNGPNSLYRPNSTSFNLTADTDVAADSFEKHALAYDASSGSAFSFAGLTGETWRFDGSSDLLHWTPISTNMFNVDGIYSMPITNTDVQLFVKGTKQ